MLQRQQCLQCVACNLMIPDSHTTDGSCPCGHVFTEKKLIGGKRFSEYRAKLYSRLEIKKQRLAIRENKLLNDKIQDKRRLQHPHSLEVNCPKSPNTEKIHKRNVIQRTRETFVKPKTIMRRQFNQPNVIKTKLIEPTETLALQNLILRFPSALAEINKRLVSQNLLWSSLDSRKL
ncbi:uncharacterized protein LOC144644331 [Oculina patagonica]